MKRAANAIADTVRERNSVRLSGAEHTAAWLQTRMPATFAASCKALDELRGAGVASVVDIGTGGGTAALAAHEKFPPAREVTLVERHWWNATLHSPKPLSNGRPPRTSSPAPRAA